jgi:sulfite exporter TauE/SafE
MTGLSLLPIFMIGLLGSVHCVGMCGGIVGAFSVASAPRSFPVPVVAMSAHPVTGQFSGQLVRTVSYNIGRIASYATAGALAGGLAGGARTLAGVSIAQMAGYSLANLMLVVLGLYLMDLWRGLTAVEAVGRILWRRIQPLTKLLLPLDSPFKMLAVGVLWGWLPCGMVYSVLLTALLSGSAVSGASVMLAFGLGTLPTLLMMGLFGARLKSGLQRRPVRLIAGLIILSFGLLGLVRAASGAPGSWLDAICITPSAAMGHP